MKENISFSLCNMRLIGQDKVFYQNKLKEFCLLFNKNKIISVQFGKQDIRGTESITLIDEKHCVPTQKHFNNKWEMLGYIVGFVEAKGLNFYTPFKDFLI